MAIKKTQRMSTDTKLAWYKERAQDTREYHNFYANPCDETWLHYCQTKRYQTYINYLRQMSGW
jgi:hypothetical protein